MGACMSRPQPRNSISHSSTPEQWAGELRRSDSGSGGSARKSSKSGSNSNSTGNPSAMSMSFLKKYSFATVNPAFADFESAQQHGTNDPEEEEATSTLRSLAQQSFGASCQPDHQWRGSNSMLGSERRVSFHDGRDQGETSMPREGSSPDSRDDHASVAGASARNHDMGLRSSRSRVKFTEEKLVMSSSCMPSYSLGVVVNPEARAKNTRSKSQGHSARQH